MARDDLSKIDKYRTVFNTETGREVLTDILSSMGYFGLEEDCPGAYALRNQAMMILEKCGFGLLNGINRENLIGSLFELPFENNKTQESIDGKE